jgi:hypothetical protein
MQGERSFRPFIVAFNSETPNYRIIEIVFQDKTSLTFNLESCLQVTPELVSWKSGSYKPLKR